MMRMLSRLLIAISLGVVVLTLSASGQISPTFPDHWINDRALIRVPTDPDHWINDRALIRVPTDTSAPSLSIIPPRNHTIIRDTATIQVEADDDVGVIGVRFYASGIPLGSEVTTPPFSFFWDARHLPEGPIELRAIARDEAGHYTEATTNVWIIHDAPASVDADNNAGALTLRDATPNPANDLFTMRFDLPEDAFVTVEVITPLGERLRVFEPELLTAGAERLKTIALADLPNGSYIYRIVANAGERSYSATGSVIVIR